MTPAEIHARLSLEFGERLGPLQPANRDPFISIPRELLLELGRFCKSTAGLDFDFLMNLSALDWPKANQLELVYHLFSYAHRHTLVLKLRVDRAAPGVPSVTSIWKVADWLEREAFDLLGIQFEGHPDLRRLLMPDDWQGHPLRKDYQEAATWHGIETTRDNPLDGFVLLDELKKRLSLSREARKPEPAASVPEPKP